MGLTVKQIEATRFGLGPERLSDGNGLYVRMMRGGQKVFQARITADGKSRWVKLGEFPDLSLKAARFKCALVRAELPSGVVSSSTSSILPVEGHQQSSSHPLPAATVAQTEPVVPTLQEYALVWFERKKTGLSNGKHIDQNWNTVRDYLLPELGDLPLDVIKKKDVIRVFEPIWHTKHETARRTLVRLSEIFELAKVKDFVEVNPTIFCLKSAFGLSLKQTRHHVSLPYRSAPDFWQWLQGVSCDEITRQIAMLIILTAKRTKELRFAEWSDLKFDGTVLETSQDRMKMRRNHRVPLSRQALVVIENMRLLGPTTAVHIFSKPKNKSGVISENGALNLIKRFDAELTTHGFRSTFRTWARKQNRYQKDAMEIALSHEKESIIAIYERDDLLEERTPLMQDWADYLTNGQPFQKITFKKRG